MPNATEHTRLSLRLYFEDGSRLGPGKAALLELIDETGSIAAAGRQLNMSYKRAWGLVDAMNSMFVEPLVTRSRGGAQHGGAELTQTGRRVLALFREVEDITVRHATGQIAEIEALLSDPDISPSDMSERK